MSEILSKYKFKRFAIESFRNGLRLHFDSILLFNNESYPSAFQLSVLSMEEISKSNWIEHVYWYSFCTDTIRDHQDEKEWLQLLYLHPKKQNAFFNWGLLYDYSPKFVEYVKKNQLELQKQRATYVGFDKNKGRIDVDGRISIPSRIKNKDAKKMISLINDYLKEVCEGKFQEECYFDIEEKDDLLNKELMEQLRKWKFKSGVKSGKWFNKWQQIMRAS